MKIVKLNKNLNFLPFLLMLTLITIGTAAFGQTADSLKTQKYGIATLAIGQTSLTPLKKEFNDSQIYGDTSLADIELVLEHGELKAFITPDEDVLEIVSITRSEKDADQVDRMSDFDSDSVIEVSVDGLVDFYIRTTRGVTSMSILKRTSERPGYILINGKLVAKYNKSEITEGSGDSDPDMFKDTAQWKWSESLID
jgi:hypothetical protein